MKNQIIKISEEQLKQAPQIFKDLLSGKRGTLISSKTSISPDQEWSVVELYQLKARVKKILGHNYDKVITPYMDSIEFNMMVNSLDVAKSMRDLLIRNSKASTKEKTLFIVAAMQITDPQNILGTKIKKDNNSSDDFLNKLLQ